MKLSAILEPLIRAGVSGDVLLATVRAFEEEHGNALEAEREKARARWRKWKAGQSDKRLQTFANVSKPLARANKESSNEDTLSEDKKVTSPSARSSRGSRIPDDFLPDIDAAVAEGVPRLEAERQARSFVDYWRAKPGKDGLKLDWPATWRVWYRRNIGPVRATAPPSHAEQVNAALDRIINGGKHDTGPTIDASFERSDRGRSEVPLRLVASSPRE